MNEFIHALEVHAQALAQTMGKPRDSITVGELLAYCYTSRVYLDAVEQVGHMQSNPEEAREYIEQLKEEGRI